MADFMIRFSICNLFISVLIGIFLAAKYLLKNHLTSHMQYRLWFLLLVLLAVPFIPAGSIPFPHIFSWFWAWDSGLGSHPGNAIGEAPALTPAYTASWMNDFSISVSEKAPSAVGFTLCTIWIAGIFVMILFVAKSVLHFLAFKRACLPLQSQAVHRIYRQCLQEMNIRKNIPVYSTAFLRSPVIAGLFCPCIYLPIHLISGCREKDIRYMLLHELQHYKHKDALANYIMNIAGIVYWFNPFVWYALREMGNDREIACDASVLEMLQKEAYQDYGNTLINFVQKVSLTPFPFTSGIHGSMAQMKKRILNIAHYHPASFRKKLYSLLSCSLIAILLLGSAPLLSIQAAEHNRYFFDEQDKDITYLDLDASFGTNNGSFVLYDAADGSWQIYNKEQAATRIAPASTYKIYSALFALESGIISPRQSELSWNGQQYVYDVWNEDQTLESAMQNSVTWYFQELDQRAGLPSIRNYVHGIGYGNQTVKGDISSYWIHSSLKISPIEQVELLERFYNNQFGFSPENIAAVKDSIFLSSSGQGSLYGKTGTAKINGSNASGWFIGYLEKEEHIYFFAANIQNDSLATGKTAANLTLSILSGLNLWEMDGSIQ